MITLKTLPQATEQEVFDHVACHLLTQSKKSLSLDGAECQYRSSDGISDDELMCSAGCLMAEDEYRDTFEGQTWEDLVANKEVPEEHSGLIGSLQSVHDNFHPDKWPGQLSDVAFVYNLQYPPY
jgi:hypothetical protein